MTNVINDNQFNSLESFCLIRFWLTSNIFKIYVKWIFLHFFVVHVFDFQVPKSSAVCRWSKMEGKITQNSFSVTLGGPRYTDPRGSC